MNWAALAGCLVAVLLIIPLASARGGGGCFTGDTVIQTPSGGVLISQLKSGDEITSFDGGANLSATARVIAVYDTVAQSYLEITTSKSSIKVTPEHLICVGNGQFKSAKDIKVNDRVIAYSDDSSARERVTSATWHSGEEQVFNLLADKQNTYIANSIVVHNKGCFLPNTQILMADETLREIRDVRQGDVITAFDYDGLVVNATVNEIYTATADGYYTIATEDHKAEVTAEHPFYMGDGLFTTANRLRAVDIIYVFNGTSLNAESIVAVEYTPLQTTVYNLRTQWPNTYFANFIAVHNKGGGGGCFAAGTGIDTPDGEKPIEKISVGDEVISVLPGGKPKTVKVLATYKTADQTMEIAAGGRSVITTGEHPFLTSRGTFVKVSQLSIGDYVIVSDKGVSDFERITSIKELDWREVYNLKIEEPSTFIANGFVVHNKGGGISGSGGGSSSDPYASELDCGISKVFYLANGTATAGQECISVTYLKANSTFQAGLLKNCSLGTQDIWANCMSFSIFASAKEKQFKCVNETECATWDYVALADGSRVKVYKPPGFVEVCLPFVLFMGIIFVVLLYSNVLRKSKSSENLDYCYPENVIDAKTAKTAKVIDYLSSIDKQWNPEALKSKANDTFLKLQECWQKRDYAPMQPLLMTHLFQQHLQQIDSLKRDHEINMIDSLKVIRVDIVNVRSYNKKNQDEYTSLIEASARDYYIDDRNNRFLRGDDKPETFQEFWVFQRQDDRWLLREVDQTRESDAIRAESFVEDLTPHQMQEVYGKLDTKINEKAPWLEEAIGSKGERIHRMLNFLSSIDKSWDEEMLKTTVRNAFVGLLTAFESQDLSPVQGLLMPQTAERYRQEVQKMAAESRGVEYRNLCVRKVDIVLVRNYSDNDRDEFTARVSAHAQKIEKKAGSTVREDEYVSPFERYATFQKQKGEWKLREFQPPSMSQSIVQQENIDEESSPDQVKWYYTQDRAL
jgi:predicted lipid-binding transport protein (Tim44 family)